MSSARNGDRAGVDCVINWCELCEAFLVDEGMCTRVRDSSFIPPHDCALDGDRIVVACSPEHLAELIKRTSDRPYVEAELWAGKIDRVLAAHPQGLSLYALATETGLTQDQIPRAALWTARRGKPFAQ
ncbi:hypothetical protein ACFU5O_35440 [Streptomyces sp. NPDC057445]|uniref:hypothetical protein n=1 Tax=Streptomyces sp. NPDC057445 TaxID=3346136 RepID=UPI0036A18BBA